MNFHLLLFGVLIAATVQVLRQSGRTSGGIGETLVVWVLVGYCGIPMMGYTVFGLLHPSEMAELTGFPAGGYWQTGATWALLAMALSATLALRYRGTYLIGPSVVWSVFFLALTGQHASQVADVGTLTPRLALMIFVTHGLVSVVLLGGLAMSGVWRLQPARAGSLDEAS